MKFKDRLKQMDACASAIEWVNGKGFKKSWETCERADWMLWYCAKMIGKPGWPTHQEIVLAACWCARRAQKHWTDKTDTRPLKAIQAAEKWAKNPTQKNKDAAAHGAAYAADAAAHGAAYAAARAAYAAADAADAAARAAHGAAYAAYAAADAARAACAAARAAEHKAMCDHIRKTLKIGSQQ